MRQKGELCSIRRGELVAESLWSQGCLQEVKLTALSDHTPPPAICRIGWMRCCWIGGVTRVKCLGDIVSLQ